MLGVSAAHSVVSLAVLDQTHTRACNKQGCGRYLHWTKSPTAMPHPDDFLDYVANLSPPVLHT